MLLHLERNQMYIKKSHIFAWIPRASLYSSNFNGPSIRSQDESRQGDSGRKPSRGRIAVVTETQNVHTASHTISGNAGDKLPAHNATDRRLSAFDAKSFRVYFQYISLRPTPHSTSTRLPMVTGALTLYSQVSSDVMVVCVQWLLCPQF